MRLTLRTLLGYLDDILEPQEARALGEKINESGFASSLVARIKDVVRRRRIAAPELTGPGSDPDPNTIAEYLDNTLPPERVEDIERLCLDSDVHLAEVAACHQILTLVLGEPVEISSAMRDRMYALGTGTAAEANGRGRVPATEGGQAAVPVVSAAPSAPERPTLPDYLKPRTTWKRWVTAAALLLLVGVWLGLIMSDPASPWKSTSTESTLAQPPVVQGDPVRPDAASVQAPATAERAIPPATTTTVEPPAATAMVPPDAVAAAAIAPPPDGAPETAPPPAPAAAPAVPPPAPADAVAAAANANPPSTSPMPMPGIPPQPVDTHRILYNSAEGVLLQLTGSGDWMVLARRSLLHPGEEVASPQPFESTLEVDDTGATVVLTGGARVRLLPTAGPANLNLDVVSGRLIVRRPAVGGGEGVVGIALSLYGGTHLLELLEPGAECGLEIIPRIASGVFDPLPAPTCDGGLYVTAGSVRLQSFADAPTTLGPRPVVLPLVAGRFESTPQSLAAAPNWMTPLSGAALTVARTYSRQFEDAFDPTRPTADTIPALVESRHPRMSELASQTLALTDDYRNLVRALRAPHEEARQAAIVGLGAWLQRSPENGSLLVEEVNRVFPANDAAFINRLLWGYSRIDGQNPDLSRQLVQCLMNGSIAIRQLAFFQIQRLTGNDVTYQYHPDSPESQRNISVKRWEERILREGALIPPTQTTTPATP